MDQPRPVETISYAQSTPLSGGRVWAAAVLAMTGLGLIALGGCFLIGVLVLFNPSLAFGPSPTGLTNVLAWTWGDYLFAGVLSLLAAICFFFAAWILWLTVRGLLRSWSAS